MIYDIIALAFFLLFFACVLRWALRGGRDRFEHMRRLPLDSAQEGGIHE
jgi:cbb3-type cytochrome oxidase subunit 3